MHFAAFPVAFNFPSFTCALTNGGVPGNLGGSDRGEMRFS